MSKRIGIVEMICDRCGEETLFRDATPVWPVVTIGPPGGATSAWELCSACQKKFDFFIKPVKEAHAVSEVKA